MSIAIGDDHRMLAEAVRRFATDRCPSPVTRAAIDDKAGELPGFWEELAGLGWLGLAVSAERGGEGYGLAEQAIVLEELARTVAPGPILPTIWAALVIGSGDADVPAGLLSGQTAGAVALGPAVAARAGDGVPAEVLLDGEVTPVAGAGLAGWLVVPVRMGGEPTRKHQPTSGGRRAIDSPSSLDGDELWVLVEAQHCTVTAVESLDPTCPAAAVTFEATLAKVLSGVTRGRVEALGMALAAAEAAGGAAWCVETAAAHAAQRRQFGRPIGQFQAVKHRCADMLVATEQARAVAWDAAAALDGNGDGDTGGESSGPEVELAVAAAGAVALDAFVKVAEDCIQVLGGIGFTWEHDAHLYLRRAVALRQLFGGGAPWRRAVATAALAGTRRHLTLDLPDEAERYRAEVRATVEEIAQLPKPERRVPLAEAGLIVPHWARPWGRDASPVEQLVIDQELRRAKVRAPHLQVGAWAAPTVAVHGTAEQAERWVRPTLHGEITWCQLFSEPEAGSDLAALTTTATRTDGGWLLNGQKVWTTMATEADWGICLARTNPSAPKHLGITYFVIDMSAAGIDIRPLRELTGLEMFNEVFLDDVFVPDDCVVGEVDGGWPLARTTLANERVSMGRGSSFGGGVEALVALVAERAADDRLEVDALVLDQLGALVAEAHSLAAMGLRATARSVSGAPPGPEASVRKLLGAEHDQRTQALGLSLLGPLGATNQGTAAQWSFGYLANRCLTIAGGTSEIQRNVIGERLLGLPRDPEPEPRSNRG